MQYREDGIWKGITLLWSTCTREPLVDARNSLEKSMRRLIELFDASRSSVRLYRDRDAATEREPELLEQLTFSARGADALEDETTTESTLSTTLAPVESVQVTIQLTRANRTSTFDRADEQVFELATRGFVRVLDTYSRTNGLLAHQTPVTGRERRVVTLLATGHRSREMAAMLELDPARIDELVDQVCTKLGVESRLELLQLVMNSARGASNPASDGRASRLEQPEPTEPEPDPFLERVLDAIRGQLDDDQLTIHAVARRLGVSKRTLQRRLATAEVTFREVTDRARKARALELLAMPGVDYTEVAHRIGYGHVSSLNRALQRWTGETPSTIRESLRGSS